MNDQPPSIRWWSKGARGSGSPEGDCDENDIPDSLDIASHYAGDLNGNGTIDTCELDYVPGSYDNRSSGWEVAAEHGDTLALERTFGKRVGYAIQCFVPRQSGLARLVVRDSTGRLVAAITDCLEPGAHQVWWALRGKNGLLVEPGLTYRLRLEQGSRSVERLICWRRELRWF